MTDRRPHEDGLEAILQHIEVAHREVQAAQKLAYESDPATGDLLPLRTRLALNRAQDTLIRLVHRLLKASRQRRIERDSLMSQSDD